jgi:hypothetical protein
MKTDPIALGNIAAQILVTQELAKCVAVAVGREPAEFGAKLSQSVSKRIDGLTLTGGDPEQMRDAARIMLRKIVEGIA